MKKNRKNIIVFLGSISFLFFILIILDDFLIPVEVFHLKNIVNITNKNKMCDTIGNCIEYDLGNSSCYVSIWSYDLPLRTESVYMQDLHWVSDGTYNFIVSCQPVSGLLLNDSEYEDTIVFEYKVIGHYMFWITSKIKAIKINRLYRNAKKEEILIPEEISELNSVEIKFKQIYMFSLF